MYPLTTGYSKVSNNAMFAFSLGNKTTTYSDKNDFVTKNGKDIRKREQLKTIDRF